jgi:hypothetical protein
MYQKIPSQSFQKYNKSEMFWHIFGMQLLHLATLLWPCKNDDVFSLHRYISPKFRREAEGQAGDQL